MAKIKITSSWDDYCKENYKLAKLLKKYDIPAIFFIECGASTKKRQIIELAKQGFEIGCHTFNHPSDLKQLDNLLLAHEILECRDFLQKLTGQEINWFCYPKGKHNEKVRRFVEIAGFKYARTVDIGNPVGSENLPNLQVNSTWHCRDRKEYKGLRWPEFAKRALQSKPKEIHFWGHAWELAREPDGWKKLENLLKDIQNYKK